jgi:hypothetical protein
LKVLDAFAIRVLLVFVLAVLSVIYPQGAWRFQAVEGEVLRNADFSQGGKFWYRPRGDQVAIDRVQHGAVLRRDGAGGVLPYVLQPIRNFADFEYFRIRAEIRLDGLRPGPKPSQRAVLTLESFSPGGAKLRYWPHDIARLSGGSGWRAVERVLPVPETAGSMRLVAFMGAERGAMAIRNITATAVTETALSRWLGRALLASWPMAALFCLTPLLRRRLITPARALVLLAGLAIVAGAMTPQPLPGQMIDPARQFSSHALAAVQNTVQSALQIIMPEEAPRPPPPIAAAGPNREAGRDAANGDAAASKAATAQKARLRTPGRAAPPGPVFMRAANPEHLGHLAAYMVLSALAFMTYGRWHSIRVILALCLFAAASEALQSFIITRDAEWMDLVFNGLGIAGGFFVAYSFAILLNRRPAFSR